MPRWDINSKGTPESQIVGRRRGIPVESSQDHPVPASDRSLGPGQALDTQEPGYPSRRLSWFLLLDGTIYLKCSYECVRGIPTRGSIHDPSNLDRSIRRPTVRRIDRSRPLMMRQLSELKFTQLPHLF